MPAKVSKHGSGNSNYKHGHALRKRQSQTYRIWAGMLDRCRRKNSKSWKYYGGRGIKVCWRWLRFSNFLADMGERPSGLTLGRIDENGDYEPDNCEWQTWQTQNNTSRNAKRICFRGFEGSIKEVCDHFGINYGRAIRRMANGWSIETALGQPRCGQIEFMGEHGTLKQLCAKHGIGYNTVRGRLRRYGWSLEEALMMPAAKR